MVDVCLLVKFFFPKWLQAVHRSLLSRHPDLNRVWEWMGLIQEEVMLMGNDNIRHQLWMSLILMERPVDGLEIVVRVPAGQPDPVNQRA